MLRGVADTHAAIWYLYGDAKLSSDAKEFIETAARDGRQIGVSSITLAEIVYLLEKKQVQIALDTFASLKAALDLGTSVLTEIPFDREIAVTMFKVDPTFIRDMPDRMITATALYFGLPLLTCDQAITDSGIVPIIW